MANKKVNIKIRVKLANGKYRYCEPVYEKKGIKKHFALVNGRAEEHPEGTYALCFYEGGKSCRERIMGADPRLIALAKQRKKSR